MLADLLMFDFGIDIFHQKEMIKSSCVALFSWQRHTTHLSNYELLSLTYQIGSYRGGDRMVVGYTTTCAISAYHH